jgi:phosphonate transport system ATP-binding protein
VARFVIEKVTARFGPTTALDSVDLTIGAGEHVGLVGPSGSGKTTLLRLLNGGLRPDGGTVAVDGRPLAALTNRELRRLRSRIGLVPQDHSLVPNLRVSQNVISGRLGRLSFPGALRATFFPRKSELEKVHSILDRVGIPEKIFERTDRLSGGQQQRVAIARTLMQEPEAVLADEPVSSVDPARARDTVALLTRLCEAEGITLVMSLHNLDLARAWFPRLVGLRQGKIVFDRATETIPDEEFDALYDLSRSEILANGA